MLQLLQDIGEGPILDFPDYFRPYKFLSKSCVLWNRHIDLIVVSTKLLVASLRDESGLVLRHIPMCFKLLLEDLPTAYRFPIRE